MNGRVQGGGGVRETESYIWSEVTLNRFSRDSLVVSGAILRRKKEREGKKKKRGKEKNRAKEGTK
jgi:hypothetical protein